MTGGWMTGRVAAAALVVLAAACSGGDGAGTTADPAGSTAATTSQPQATTGAPAPNPAGLPAAPGVDRLSWEGSVLLSGPQGAGDTLDAEISGTFVSPGLHRVEVRRTLSTAAGEEFSEEWVATLVGEIGWVLEDGDLSSYDAESVADEYMTVMSTATGTVLPSSTVLAALAEIETVATVDWEGRTAAVFDIPEAPLGVYSPLFASDFGIVFGGSSLVADVSLTVDVATGVVLEAALSGSGDGVAVEMSFAVTGLDDPGIAIETAPVAVPESDALETYSDPEGRFSVGVPAGWDVDVFGDGILFRPPLSGGEVFTSVVVDPTAGTPAAMVDSLLADAPAGLEILLRETVSSGERPYERLNLRYPSVGGDERVAVWATSEDGTGYAVQVRVDAELFAQFAEFAEAVFDSFRPGG